MFDVVIPTHNNLRGKGASLPLTLQSICSSSQKRRVTYVVSNGDDDPQTREWLQNTVQHFPDTELLWDKNASRSNARNVGIRACSADYVLLVDDDVVVSPEAMGLFEAACLPSCFSCGARRRYVPYGWRAEVVAACIQARDFTKLDRMAADEQQPSPGPRGEYKGRSEQSTFITCFGGAPRESLLALGGLDTEYRGWGLEDSDLMRRLIVRHDFRSLSGGEVWHLDHLVHPYIWKEHFGGNWHTFIGKVPERGFIKLRSLFSRQFVQASDPAVYLAPVATGRDEWPKQLASGYSNALTCYIEKNKKDTNVAAIILSGSARWKREPRDLDIVKVVFHGKERFSCKKEGVRIEEHTIDIDSAHRTIRYPQFLPDTWPIAVSWYCSGLYLAQSIALKSFFTTEVRDAISKFWLHLLTYHLGRAFTKAQERKEIDRGPAVWHASIVMGLATGSLPAMARFPYFLEEGLQADIAACAEAVKAGTPEMRADALLRALGPHATVVVEHHQHSERGRAIVYPDSMVGLQVLRENLRLEVPEEQSPVRN